MAQRDLSNVLSGPCRLALGGVDLGHTVGETRLTVTPLLRECACDLHGRTPVDYVHLGETVELTARVAEWTVATLSAIYPVSTAADGLVSLGASPGTRLSSLAAELVLHPLERAAEDTSRDITFWKAVAIGAVSVGFSREGDRLFDLSFRMLPDTARDAGERIGTIGAA